MHSISWLLSLSPVIAFLCNFIIQTILSRFTKNLAVFVYTGLVVGLIVNVMLLIYLFMPDHLFIYFSYSFASLITYLALSFCYWGFLNLNRTSLRIRILRELIPYKTNGLNREKIFAIYKPQELLNVRLNRLAKAGKIIKNAQNKWQVARHQSRELFILAYCLGVLRKIIIPKTHS